MELPNIKKVGILSAFFVLSMLVINYVFTFVFGSSVKAGLFALTSYPSMLPVPQQTFGTSLGGTIMSWIGSVVPVPNLGTIFLLYLSALVLIYAGSILVSLGLPVLKTQVGKIFSIVAWGTVLGYAILIGAYIPSSPLMTIIGIAVYTGIASYLTALLGSVTKQDL